MQINKVDYYPETLDAIAQITINTSYNDLMSKVCMQNYYRLSNITATSYEMRVYSGMYANCSSTQTTNFEDTYRAAFVRGLNYKHNYVVSNNNGDSTLTITTQDGDVFIYGTEKVLSTSEITANNTKVFYPNPAKDLVNFHDASEINQINIYNSAGALVLSSAATSELDIKSLEKGSYILSISKKNKSENFKLIKN